MTQALSVQFWGARGSIPTPGTATARYGGNTACVEVRCGDDFFIFDAGSGLRLLGDELMRQDAPADAAPTDIDIVLSHCHIDHLIGLPFFAPMLKRYGRIRLWAGNLQPKLSLKEAVHRLISFPLFPIDIDLFRASVEFHDFRPGDALKLRDGISLQTQLLRHPGGSVGFRLDYDGRALAYLTDTECGDAETEARLMTLARNTDLMICDATYTGTELPERLGWGHSSWQQSIRLANAASARQLCLFHHDPDHDDRFLDAIAAAAAAARPATIIAREGLRLAL